jgi:hypothetical protein
MTNRFARAYHKIRDRLGGRRKLALAIIALWIAAELIAVAAVAVAGKEWLGARPSPAKANGGNAPALGFSASRSSPSIAVF